MWINENHQLDLIGLKEHLKLFEINHIIKEPILVPYSLQLILDNFAFFFFEREQKAVVGRREDEDLVLCRGELGDDQMVKHQHGVDRGEIVRVAAWVDVALQPLKQYLLGVFVKPCITHVYFGCVHQPQPLLMHNRTSLELHISIRTHDRDVRQLVHLMIGTQFLQCLV